MNEGYVVYDEGITQQFRRGFVQTHQVLNPFAYEQAFGSTLTMASTPLREGWEHVAWALEPQPVTFEAKLKHEIESWHHTVLVSKVYL